MSIDDVIDRVRKLLAGGPALGAAPAQIKRGR
jgi:hypothetical protein